MSMSGTQRQCIVSERVQLHIFRGPCSSLCYLAVLSSSDVRLYSLCSIFSSCYNDTALPCRPYQGMPNEFMGCIYAGCCEGLSFLSRLLCPRVPHTCGKTCHFFLEITRPRRWQLCTPRPELERRGLSVFKHFGRRGFCALTQLTTPRHWT